MEGATDPVLNWKVFDVLMVTSDVNCAYQSTLPALEASITATNRIVPHPADAVGNVIVPELDPTPLVGAPKVTVCRAYEPPVTSLVSVPASSSALVAVLVNNAT